MKNLHEHLELSTEVKDIYTFEQRVIEKLLLNQPNLMDFSCDPEFFDVAIISHFARNHLKTSPIKTINHIPDSVNEYRVLLNELTQSCENEMVFMRALRQFRNMMLVLIAKHQIKVTKDNPKNYQCHINEYESNTKEILLMLSNLAEALILHSANWAYSTISNEIGKPTNQSGQIQPFIILAMGKLGGRELNFSSDIDLIFTYPESGETVHESNKELAKRRSTKDNNQFFQKVAQKVIRLLDTVTEDGFVYRVDMRLRPLGDSGPLVISFSALEDYYQEQGRDWERYAMVKARVLGELPVIYQQKLESVLRPFTYRRYIDFSVIDSLRQMKALIDREVRRRENFFDIKLSAGGIREVEFIIQVFQLIHGGRHPNLRSVSILNAISTINTLELLPNDILEQIESHYLYYRRIENIIQSLNDEQTQQLPENSNDQFRLMHLMGFNDWSVFLTDLQSKMHFIREIFDALIGDENNEPQKQISHGINQDTLQFESNEIAKGVLSYESCSDIWIYILQGDSIEAIKEKIVAFALSELSEHYEFDLIETLHAFYQEISNRTIGPKGRDVLNRLIPLILYSVLPQDKATEVLKRILHVLKQIVTRTTYLQLLLENGEALHNLINLCKSSTLITKRLARYPHLLGELLDAKTLYHPLELNDYGSEIRQYLLRTNTEDEEERLNALCQFKQIQQLRIAAADISGHLPTMKVSDHLTKLAEVIVESVVEQAWKSMVFKHGLPSYLNDAEMIESQVQGFYIIAYGKLAGWELGYRSDLDLVFLTDKVLPGQTQGKRSIDNQLFYQRLAQRVLHLLSARTNIGLLYEVDTRLRPQGESGLLVNDFDSFKRYLNEDAWTYELQALVRSRVVYSPTVKHNTFMTIRHDILSKNRDESELRQEIVNMREKMLNNIKNSSDPNGFDIKYDRGGITDIEFIAQYLVLKYATNHELLTVWPDNIRIFESLKLSGLLTQEQEKLLCDIYIDMRNQIHHLSLQDRAAIVDDALFREQRLAVIDFWDDWLAS
ncbi:bifunctional [glutamate--ammonia ligase]-adenylyl-L-tyrosine phosphorylase/[glutamate--ammonia-ligase] adenylyltransferase [Thorsellia anophelis]|uniref:Bifunctional glutamine synthetase adenylyltransferase/adenylyl-removing enzyme n=1 Tax=Thorsellia anophelis DSM 18579 TaxID=1123402 RepID=A0A1I0EFY2_9GAMM|nr:bifunctional [glutamate--ammonia ligase]-adenylyl-L-tyrosine phosphorylase/[glutamate--ammonia-ligase] adenylyltransferase [Thorsellia anophelis]SET43939.1 glutamate-ammonia-ligase adenylyltransferase [Thorsellia anophelis DSM 18579]